MIDLAKIFSNNISTLKETSVDDRNKRKPSYMTESIVLAIDFDKVKDEYIKGLSLKETPSSIDAVIQNKAGKIIFIEFKNGHIDGKEAAHIRKKVYDSVLIFTDRTSVGISYMRKWVEYILVYNENVNQKTVENKKKYIQESSAFNSLAKSISSLAKKEFVGFGMDIFENYCFTDVHTYTTDEFEKHLTNFIAV